MHSPEWTARILMQVAVVGGAGLIGFLLLTRRVPWGTSLRPGCWFGFPYVFGAVSCVLGLVVPEPEWREPLWDGGPSFATAVALVGVGLILLGAGIHLVLWRLGRLAGSRDARLWPKLAAGLALFGVVFEWLAHRGVNVGLWLALGCGVLLVVTIGLWVLLEYVRAANAPSTRIARLIGEGRLAEAIQIGEAIPPEDRDAFVQHNLAVAYCESDDLDRAEGPFAELRARPDLHRRLKELSGSWMERIARGKAAREAEGRGDGAEPTQGPEPSKETNMEYEVRPVMLRDAQGATIPGEFRLWEEEPGRDEVRLELVFGGRSLSAASPEGYFHAMVEVRKVLEAQGLRPLCFGACANVSPSPMVCSMGSGELAYRLTLGQPARRQDLVSVFDADGTVVPVPADVQAAFHEKWLASLGAPRTW